jgi:adenine-specific DNA-methyltransferase
VVADEQGAVTQIESVEHAHGQETVYDLTVEEDHSFVTEAGVAHNCGSGTTAYVAEQWGRRWITIDTSRVALALARTRLMAARFPYYLLADSPEGVAKEAELTGQTPPSYKTENDIRKGFVYKRVPHVTLKSIANNPDIQEGMSRAEIDAAIARHADTEFLFDRPYEDGKRIRVTGPLTVESLSPHRMLAPEEERPATERAAQQAPGPGQFETMILDYLRKAGVQFLFRDEHLRFDRLDPYAGTWLHAEGEYAEGERTRRVAVCIGPEHGTVGPELVKEAAKEAVKGVGFDLLIVCGFAFDPHAYEAAGEFRPAVAGKSRAPIVAEAAKQYGKLNVLLARMNNDLSMGEELLKKTGAGNLFMVFGEPDLDIQRGEDGKLAVEVRGVDVYDPTTGEVRGHSTDDMACWFIDTDYNGESFFVRHAYFTGADRPYEKLQRALRAEIDEAAWAELYSTRSRPFDPPSTGKIAVKVINHYGDEVLKVYEVGPDPAPAPRMERPRAS